MAAKALKKAAADKGYSIFVETQGQIGIENSLTDEQITNADIVILSSDIEIQNPARFKNKRVIECKIKDLVRNAKKVVDDITF